MAVFYMAVVLHIFFSVQQITAWSDEKYRSELEMKSYKIFKEL